MDNNIEFLHRYTLSFEADLIRVLEKKYDPLSPAGKYQVYLLAFTMVSNWLRVYDFFNRSKIDTSSLTEYIIEDGLKTYEFYKSKYLQEGGTFINLREREFYKKSLDEIRINSLLMLQYFKLELENPFSFDGIYVSIYRHPFIHTQFTTNENLRNKIRSYIFAETEISFYDSHLFHEIIINFIKDKHTKGENNFLFKKWINLLPPSKVENKNCYIATLVYDDINHPKVEFLRRYRDEKLLTNLLGKAFVKFYYLTSPTLVRILKPFKRIQSIIRLILDNIIIRNLKS